MTKRAQTQTIRPEADVLAAAAYRDALIEAGRVDSWAGPYPLWHGWVIVEAYLAGLDAGRASAAAPQPEARP